MNDGKREQLAKIVEELIYDARRLEVTAVRIVSTASVCDSVSKSLRGIAARLTEEV